jgi:regulatory protein YycI of two-component signal transduction system YycFG
MDWNKSNTILILAFIILNIFLFVSSYNNIISAGYDVSSDKEFLSRLEEVLKDKNIIINTDLPKDNYILPILDTEYEIINIDKELLNRFLGPGVEPSDDVTIYANNNGEVLEIVDGKKLHYTLRQRIPGEAVTNDSLVKYINEFIESKKIDSDGYFESYRHVSSDNPYVVYTKKYSTYSMDNSYMKFYFDKEGIYRFEMQNIISVRETAEKIRTFSAAEALPRLLSYENIRNKEIVHIEMTFYSVEDENWKYISGIFSYPVWKVIFNDGTEIHLSSINTYYVD